MKGWVILVIYTKLHRYVGRVGEVCTFLQHLPLLAPFPNGLCTLPQHTSCQPQPRRKSDGTVHRGITTRIDDFCLQRKCYRL